jgi:hypothetical protein
MKASFSFLFVLLFSQMSLAAESFHVEIKSFKNGILRTNSNIVTLLGTKAKLQQNAGQYYLSREVLFENSSEELVDLNLNIQEHLQDVSFSLSDSSQISKSKGYKKLSIQAGEDLYSYEISVEMLPTN